MDVLLLLNIALVVIVSIKLFQIIFLNKVKYILQGINDSFELPTGKFNIVFRGKIDKQSIKMLQYDLRKMSDGEQAEVSPLPLPFTSLWGFKVFSRVARFEVTGKGNFSLIISGIEHVKCLQSRLFLKNILFSKPFNERIIIGVMRPINFALFFILGIIDVVSIIYLLG